MNRLAQASQGGERTPGRELGGSRASEGKVSTLSRLWTVVTKKCQDIPDSRSTQRLPKVLCGADSGSGSVREASTREKRGLATERVWHSGSRSEGYFRTGKVQSVELSVPSWSAFMYRFVHSVLPFILFY